MINFETSPDQYKHWKLKIDGAVATFRWMFRRTKPWPKATS